MEKNFQRWTAKRKTELVLSHLKGEMKQVEACRRYDLKQSEVESWTETFLKSGEQGLKSNSKDQQFLHEKEVKELQAKVGELVMELNARKKLEALLESQESWFFRCRARWLRKERRSASPNSVVGFAFLVPASITVQNLVNRAPWTRTRWKRFEQ